MRLLVALTLAVGAGLAKPAAKSYAASYGYGYHPLAITGAPLVNPSSQFHAQDEAGQYNYGYSGPNSAKQEVRTADGTVRGSYSYIDANGIVQRVEYISDILGFRTAATNLPVHVAIPAAGAPVAPAVPVAEAVEIPEVSEKVLADPVAAAAAEPVVPYAQATVKAATAGTVLATPSVIVPTVAYTYLPYATNYGYYFTPGVQSGQVDLTVPVSQPIEAPAAAATVVVEAEPTEVQQPVVPAVPVVPIQSQYHAQDEFGQYNFGYQEPNSNREEVKSADGVVRGSYNYVDDQGKIQTVQYVADAQGFRASGTTIPVHAVDLPAAVEDSPEVAAAREEHNRLFAEIAARNAELADQALAQQAELAAAAAVPVVQFEAEPAGEPVAYTDDTVVVGVQAPPAAAVAAAEVPAAQPVPAVPAAVAAPAIVPVPVAVQVPAVPVVPSSSQYHAQDEFGQYNYGYANADSSKVETKTADGVVRGAYKYIDAEGKLQVTEYISDALGFRVAATNLPTHVIAGAEPAVAEPAAADQPALVQAAPVMAAKVPYVHLPYAVGYSYLLPPGSFASPAVPAPAVVAPVAQAAAPEAPPAVVAVEAEVAEEAAPAAVPAAVPVPALPATQYQAQDEAGQYNYGYSGPTSAKQETKTADGVVRGTYSYVDANGLLQKVDYISDVLGFRAVGTNIPSGHPVMAPKIASYAYLPYAVNHPYYTHLQQ